MDLSDYRQPKLLLDKGINWFWINIYGVGFHTVSETPCWPHSASPRSIDSRYIYNFHGNFGVHIGSWPVQELVADAWWNEDPILWKRSPYYEDIKMHREFHEGIKNKTIVPTEYYDPKHKNQYYVDRRGYLWSTNHIYRHKASYTPDGYANVKISVNGKKSTKKLHRLVARAFCEIPKRHLDNGLTYSNLEVNHIDGNPSNNCADNLEWCTGSENVQHAFRLNETRGGHKVLSEQEFDSICKMLVLGVPDGVIGKKVGRASELIHSIRHLTRPKYRTAWEKYKWPSYQEIVQRRKLICKFLENGFRSGEISQITGMSDHLVAHAIKPSGSKHPTDISIQNRIAAAKAKFSWKRTIAQQRLFQKLLPDFQKQYQSGEIPKLDDPRFAKP